MTLCCRRGSWRGSGSRGPGCYGRCWRKCRGHWCRCISQVRPRNGLRCLTLPCLNTELTNTNIWLACLVDCVRHSPGATYISTTLTKHKLSVTFAATARSRPGRRVAYYRYTLSPAGARPPQPLGHEAAGGAPGASLPAFLSPPRGAGQGSSAAAAGGQPGPASDTDTDTEMAEADAGGVAAVAAVGGGVGAAAGGAGTAASRAVTEAPPLPLWPHDRAELLRRLERVSELTRQVRCIHRVCSRMCCCCYLTAVLLILHLPAALSVPQLTDLTDVRTD